MSDFDRVGNPGSSQRISSDDSLPLSREAIPGSAEVRTGTEPRKVLHPTVRIRDKTSKHTESPMERDYYEESPEVKSSRLSENTVTDSKLSSFSKLMSSTC